MKLKNTCFSLLLIMCFYSNAQEEAIYLTKAQVESDLAFLNEILEEKSSYQGLNGYDYKADFKTFVNKLKADSVAQYDFGLFLAKTIGQIGDRHAYIKGYAPRNTLFFPLAFAPFMGKVAVINYHRETKAYAFFNSTYPYLKSINKIPVKQVLTQVLPGEELAPEQTRFTRSVRNLRDIEAGFKILGQALPNPLPITLYNEAGEEKELIIDLVDKKKRARLWDERFYRSTFFITDEQYNDSEFIKRFFKLEKGVGYIQLADMVDKKECPVFFKALNHFMTKARNTDALIVDVRDNGGGTRDLIQELAGYLIHSDSVYVVNAVKQRGELPLKKGLKKRLYNRFLLPKAKLNKEEQAAVDRFMAAFNPMYKLDEQHFSEYYFYVLNGKKLGKKKYHYNKPVYILANERSFSAASVLVAAFKGLAHVKIVGVTTDGSSGNSQRFELPHSELRGKISTMVSFQKDGQILDGIGTAPDIVIERSLNQIFGKEDHQLERLMEIARGRSN